MFSLKNKIAIVTGASQGIGKSISEIFSIAGAHVVCLARNEDRLRELVSEISTNGNSASYISCDVSDGNSIEDALRSVVKDYKQIDILVNNAGITKDSLILRMKEQNWDQVMNTNLKGAFYSTKIVLRHMMKKKYGARVLQ